MNAEESLCLKSSGEKGSQKDITGQRNPFPIGHHSGSQAYHRSPFLVERIPPPFPALQPYPPPMPFAPSAPPVRRRSRAGIWILISVLIVLVLAAVASFFVISYVNRSTPDRTLDAFCSALQQADYSSAYDQFSARLQQTISEAAFAAAFTQDSVTACTHGTTGDSGNSVTNNLKLVHASKGINNDIVTLTRDSNGEWKIDDIFRQT